MKTTKGGKWAIGTLLAALVGFVTGILTAPKSGKETRKEIKTKATQEVGNAEVELQKVYSELEKIMKKVKENSGDSAQTGLDEAMAQSKDIKNKTKKLLMAAKNGDADDHEVAKILKDVKKTIKHLKQYYTS